MEGLRQYLLGVICAAMLSGVVLSLFPEGKLRSWMQLICGILLTVTLLEPISRGQWKHLLPELPDYSEIAQREAERGRQMAEDSQRAIIKQRLEAYVLDKAKTQEITLSLLLSEGEPPVPTAAFLAGPATPEEKAILTQILTEDLGIPKEAQTWIGAA